MVRNELKRVQILNALEEFDNGRHDGEMLLSQVMTSDPSCVATDATVVELVRMLNVKAFRHLLVTDNSGKLVGVISDRDILRCLGPGRADKERLGQITARELMSTDLLTVSSGTTITEAVQRMIEHGISCLPVVDGEALVGIITSTDFHLLLQVLLQTVRTTEPRNSPVATGEQARHSR